jgi:pyruvate dehydrogenase E2 component (dihydrolipoamide acetyltransferase)
MPYIEMPKLSDTMTAGTVVKWLKAVGDSVSAGDMLAEIETDKAVMELEAFDNGTLKEIYVPDGGKAQIGEKLALLFGAGESARSCDAPVAERAGGASSPEPPRKPNSGAGFSRDEGVAPAFGDEASQLRVSAGRVKASPLAKKIAAAKGVDLVTIHGSGPGGRVVAKDLESASAKTSCPPVAAATPMIPAALPEGAKRIPLSGMRKIIAERLLASKTQIPHFYLNIEVDAGELLKFRAQTNAYLEKSGAGKLTINDLVLKAVIAAAVKVPRVNASFAGDAIIEYADVHLSVAVAIEDGLVTPVIRQAQKKSLREISEAVKDLATRARTKKLKPEEYQGGTITVSNLGSHGIDSFFAVINPPQAIILAIGAIVKKPVVNAQDEIVPAHRLAIGLSADHRVVDGAIGAQYLAELRLLIENPALMLI